MNLNHLTDTTLLLDTKNLARKEKEITTKVLHHLKEIERRRLFSDLGHSSLFAYATKELDYSEGAAYRRIQGARLLNELPEIEKSIESGKLSLTNLGQASQFFKEKSVKSSEEKNAVLGKIANTSKRECEKILFELRGESAPIKKDKVRRNSPSSQELKFTVKDQTMEKLNELKDLLAHKGEMSMDELLAFSLEAATEKVRKQRFKLDPKTKRRTSPAKVNSRYISNAVKRNIYNRDKGKWQKCGSHHKVQYDHETPFALGGETSCANLRLLCFSCNQRHRIREKL